MTYKIEIEIKESTVNEIFSNFTYPYPCWIDHEYNYLANHDKTRFIIKEADDNGWVYEVADAVMQYATFGHIKYG